MNGHVFQVFHECNDKRQFTRTLEALEEHFAKTFKHAGDMVVLTRDLKNPSVQEPADLPDEETSRLKIAIFEKQVAAYVTRCEILKSNLQAAYAIIWGQCSEAMKAKLQGLEKYETSRLACDCAWLLTQIKGIRHKFEEKRYGYASLNDAYTNFYLHRQQPDEPLSDYLHQFKENIDVLEHYGGSVGVDKGSQDLIVKYLDPDVITTSETKKRMSRDRALAIQFLKGADKKRFGNLLIELENQFTRGTDQYPVDVTAAYGMLVSYRGPRQPQNQQQGQSSTSNGLQFAQTTTAPVPGLDGILHEAIICFHCQGPGHYASQCPHRTDNNEATAGVTMLQSHGPVHNFTFLHFDCCFSQSRHVAIPDSWVLLDSQSTVSVFRNATLLQNIRPAASPLTVYTNGGSQISRLVGDIPNFGEVWFNPQSLANILSLAAVRQRCRVTMDTAGASAIAVHRKDGSVMLFKESPMGLYYFDVNDPTNSINSPSAPYLFLHSATGYSPREVEGADRARTLYRQLGRPSQRDFLDALANNVVQNCPVTPEDAKRALKIYGPDPATIKGKTVKRPTPAAPQVVPTDIPTKIKNEHRRVTICADNFYVQGHIFCHTISKHLHFRTVAAISNRRKATLEKEIKDVINMYHARGFEVTDFHADNEFAPIQQRILPVLSNIVAADDHVGQVERSIRTIKERVRALVHGLPYRRYPSLLVREIVAHAVRTLNQLPSRKGVSTTMSPRKIVTGLPDPDFNNMRIEFGHYAQIFEERRRTNTTAPRTIGAIALNPTGNTQGSYYFLSLDTGARVTRQQWTELPITQAVIDRVEELAEQQDQPLIDGELVFEWAPNMPIIDDNNEVPNDNDDLLNDDESDGELEEGEEETDDGNSDDSDPNENDVESSSDEPPASDEDDDDEPPMVSTTDDEDNDDDNDNDDDHGEIEEEEGAHSEMDEDEGANGPDEDEGAHHTQESQDEDEGANDYDEHSDEDGDGEATAMSEDDMPQHEYNLRSDRTRSYSHRLDHQMDTADGSTSYMHMQFLQRAIRHATTNVNERKPIHSLVAHFIFTQMSAQAGIKKHGQKAIDALLKEFIQLDNQDTFDPQDASKLTAQQKKAALRSVNVIKEKRCGKIKGRSCADGRSQRPHYDKSETASPALSTDTLIMSLIIDAIERRKVITADIAGAYLNAFMRDYVLMKLTGDVVDIFCQIDEKYKKFVVMEGKTKVLYVRLNKALYGCVQSALLWYELFSTTLKEMGFELNPYDPCVANKMINGRQCTVTWYVDDLKASHVEEKVIEDVVAAIEAKFGKMSVCRGKEHTYLGMKITINDNGTVSIIMPQYIDEAIDMFGENVTQGASTPARKGLFTIKKNSPILSKEKKDKFHSIVAKLLYLSQRARIDIQTAIAFLCTRVAKCTVDDWAKLKRVLQYLYATKELEYIVGADDVPHLKTWVDASFAVHDDMRSHTGGVMSLGRGAIIAKSRKQKLNTKSSTEAEVVGASDYLPNTIWAKRFLEAQGYEIASTKFAQDNQSAIKLEKNGRASAGKQSRHVDIRYFFIKDRIKQENIDIHYCPTEEMLADFYTKPLQGSLFIKFRDVLLGHKPIDSLQGSPCDSSTHEERVGNNDEDGKMIHESSEPPGDQIETMTGTTYQNSHEQSREQEDKRVTFADVVKYGKPKTSEAKKMNAHSLEIIKKVK